MVAFASSIEDRNIDFGALETGILMIQHDISIANQIILLTKHKATIRNQNIYERSSRCLDFETSFLSSLDLSIFIQKLVSNTTFFSLSVIETFWICDFTQFDELYRMVAFASSFEDQNMDFGALETGILMIQHDISIANQIILLSKHHLSIFIQKLVSNTTFFS
jgi:hypothetical protein